MSRFLKQSFRTVLLALGALAVPLPAQDPRLDGSGTVVVEGTAQNIDYATPDPNWWQSFLDKPTFGESTGVQVDAVSDGYVWVAWQHTGTWGDGPWLALAHKPFSKDEETLSIEREWKREIVGGGTLKIRAVELKYEQSTSTGGKDVCNSTGNQGEWVWFYSRDLVSQNNWKYNLRYVIAGGTYDFLLEEGYIQSTSGVDWNPKKVWGEGPANPNG